MLGSSAVVFLVGRSLTRDFTFFPEKCCALPPKCFHLSQSQSDLSITFQFQYTDTKMTGSFSQLSSGAKKAHRL